jgi:hypothetical protein
MEVPLLVQPYDVLHSMRAPGFSYHLRPVYSSPPLSTPLGEYWGPVQGGLTVCQSCAVMLLMVIGS